MDIILIRDSKKWTLTRMIKMLKRRIMIFSSDLQDHASLRSIKSKLKNRRKNLLKKVQSCKLFKQTLKSYLSNLNRTLRC
jgi:hypothetical protein